MSLIAARLDNGARDFDLDEAAEDFPDVADRLEGVWNSRVSVHRPWVLEGEDGCLEFVFLAILFGQMIWWLLKRIEELMVRDQLEKL